MEGLLGCECSHPTPAQRANATAPLADLAESLEPGYQRGLWRLLRPSWRPSRPGRSLSMLEIQLFEFTLLGLVQAQGEDLRGSADYRPSLEQLFTLTAGQLRRRANIDDEEL